MIMDNNTDYSCNEDELKCFELIVRHAKDNIQITLAVDEFHHEMEQSGIAQDQFDNVLSKMESFLVIKREPLGGVYYIYINSSEVQAVKAMMKKIECPDCGKPGIHTIQKHKCRFCEEEHDIDIPE